MKTGAGLIFLVLVLDFVNGDDEKTRTLYKKMIARRREVRTEEIITFYILNYNLF